MLCAPPSQKKQFQEMVESYFKERGQLSWILFLFDIRRIPKAEDATLLKWLLDTGKPVLLLFTKIDKVGRTEEASHVKKILAAFQKEGIELPPHVLFSVPKHRGREELINWINNKE